MQIEPLKMVPVQMHGESHLGETAETQETAKSFGDYLGDALTTVNDLEKNSASMNAALATGQVEDVSQVVIAAQKADIAMQLTLQVRNKAIDAYQELMRMQV